MRNVRSKREGIKEIIKKWRGKKKYQIRKR